MVTNDDETKKERDFHADYETSGLVWPDDLWLEDDETSGFCVYSYLPAGKSSQNVKTATLEFPTAL